MARKTAQEQFAAIVAEVGTQSEVAARLSCSPSRVGQIVAGQNPGLTLAIRIWRTYQIPITDWVR